MQNIQNFLARCRTEFEEIKRDEKKLEQDCARFQRELDRIEEARRNCEKYEYNMQIHFYT